MWSPITTVKKPTAFERVPWEQSKNIKKYWLDKKQYIVDKDGDSGFNSRFYLLTFLFFIYIICK